MLVNVQITGNLEVSPDDAKRMKADDASTLLRALVMSGSQIKTRISEVYQKKAE